MPILFVHSTSAGCAVDPERLGGLLCPYHGGLTRTPLGRGELWSTKLVAIEPAGITAPAGSQKRPQAAWLSITVEGESVRFETDSLGTFPLWIGRDATRLVVTSEVKSLEALGFPVQFDPESWPSSQKRPPDYSPYTNVQRVRPGAVLRVAPDGTTSVEVRTPLDYQPSAPHDTELDHRTELEMTLLASASAIASAGDHFAAFLSGGIDSSMATALVGRHHPDLRTFTLGTEHGDEYADAAELALHLGLPHTRVHVSHAEASAHFERAVFCNETIDGLTAETLAQLGVLAAAAARAGCQRVVTGYGADLLFGSMLRHRLYLAVTGVDDLRSLIERTVWSGEFAPFYAWSLGLEVHHLFWDPAVMNTAFRIPPEASFDGVREKLVLRNMAVDRGHLIEAHAFRKKQALTDGTQFNRLLSEALGLEDRHAYDGKSARAVAILRRRLHGAGAPIR